MANVLDINQTKTWIAGFENIFSLIISLEKHSLEK